MEIKTIAEECVQWEHPAPRTPQVKAAGTLSASPASQAEQGSSWRVDPDEAKVLLGFHECFLCSWNPFGSQGGSHGVFLAMSLQEGR